jgi:hypothetical protein
VLCKAYRGGVSRELPLSGSDLLREWFSDPFTLFKSIANLLGVPGNASVSKISARRLDLKGYLLGYVIELEEDDLRREETVYIVCAEDPDRVYSEIRELDLHWRRHGFYRYCKAVMLENYVNMSGVKELDMVLDEAEELLGDIEDYAYRNTLRANTPKSLKELLVEYRRRSSFKFALEYIAYPLSINILLDLIGGNIVGCFFQLRLMLEALVKSLVVDYMYRFEEENPLKSLLDALGWSEHPDRREREKSRMSVRKTPIVLQYHLRVILGYEGAQRALSLWDKLSAKWAHFEGYVERTIERIEKMSRGELTTVLPIPPDMFIVPSDYDEEFKPELKELWATLREMRELICDLYRAWLKLVSEKVPDILNYIESCKLKFSALRVI